MFKRKVAFKNKVEKKQEVNKVKKRALKTKPFLL